MEPNPDLLPSLQGLPHGLRRDSQKLNSRCRQVPGPDLANRLDRGFGD